jgi:hypothetical protein
MLRIKKLIPVALALLITLSLTACESVPAAADTPLDEIEYKTIEPPEDGWTLEQFNEVLYINGRNVKIPFCINDLGDNVLFGEVKYFTGSNPNVDKETNEAFKNTASTLIYKNEISDENLFGIVLAEVNNEGEFDRNCMIRDIGIRIKEPDSISINGWNYTLPNYELEKALGRSYISQSKSYWVCKLRDSDYLIKVGLWGENIITNIHIGNLK